MIPSAALLPATKPTCHRCRLFFVDRVSGRVFDLRRHGYAIKATAGAGGVWTYELEEQA